MTKVLINHVDSEDEGAGKGKGANDKWIFYDEEYFIYFSDEQIMMDILLSEKTVGPKGSLPHPYVAIEIIQL